MSQSGTFTVKAHVSFLTNSKVHQLLILFSDISFICKPNMLYKNSKVYEFITFHTYMHYAMYYRYMLHDEFPKTSSLSVLLCDAPVASKISSH